MKTVNKYLGPHFGDPFSSDHGLVFLIDQSGQLIDDVIFGIDWYDDGLLDSNPTDVNMVNSTCGPIPGANYIGWRMRSTFGF